MSGAPTHGLRREQLPNGVTLLVKRRRFAPAAALATHVRAGFLDEPDQVAGISHVLEHMLFKGTATLGPGELARRTKALGGRLNAFTSYDATVYYASVPAAHAAELIALQADQVRNPALDADELRRELGVIIQEARRKLDSPGAVTGEALHTLLYHTHRLRRWRIGTEDVLNALSRDDVAHYFASRYVPARVIVAMVADVDEDAALDRLRAAWGDWSAPSAPIAPGPPESSPPVAETRRLEGDVEVATLALGWRAPGVLDAGIPALDFAGAILGAGRGSRLARAVRDRGYAMAIGTSRYGVRDAGVFTIDGELEPGSLGLVLDAALASVRHLGEHGPDQAEFMRARSMLLARTARRLERYESLATALAAAEALGDVGRLDREAADFLAVTPEGVRDGVRRWLVPGQASAVAYIPHAAAVAFDVERLGAAWRAPFTAPAPLAGAEAASRAPHRAPPARLRDVHGPVHHLAVDDCDILTAQFGDTGQTSLGFYRLRAGFEAPPTAGLTALMVRGMLRGTKRLGAAQLAFAIESLGGALRPTLNADLVGFGTIVLSDHVADAAALIDDVIRHPRFDPDDVEIERALLTADARSIADDMMRFPVQLALGVAFDEIGYGSPLLGTEAAIGTFDVARLRQAHRDLLAAGRTTIVAVGDAEPVAVADALAGVLHGGGDAPAGAGAPRTDRLPVRPGRRVARRDREQAALAMLFPGPSRTGADRFAAEVWSAVAAGLGGRLFESLRSARSLAYTVIADSWQRRSAGGFLTYIATDPARLDEARDAMLDELDRFRREPPAADEVARATAMLAGEATMSRQTAGGFGAEIADAWLLGDGLDELRDPAAPYRAVDAEAVHRVVRDALDPASRAEGVVTPLAPG